MPSAAPTCRDRTEAPSAISRPGSCSGPEAKAKVRGGGEAACTTGVELPICLLIQGGRVKIDPLSNYASYSLDLERPQKAQVVNKDSVPSFWHYWEMVEPVGRGVLMERSKVISGMSLRGYWPLSLSAF